MKNKLIYLLLIIAFCWLAYLSFYPQQEEAVSGDTTIYTTKEISGFSTDLTKVAQNISDSLVTVESNSGLMTGFFYRSEGDAAYFLSAYHGIGEGEIKLHFTNSYVANAELVAYDELADLCLLKAEFPYQINGITFASAQNLSKGEFVLAFGSPASLDYDNTLSLGLIGSNATVLENEISVNGENYEYYQVYGQMTSNLSEGFSGGPIFNMDGQLVGMSLFRDSNDQTLSFFLRSEEIDLLARRMINAESVSRVNWGIKTKAINELADYLKAANAIELTLNEGLLIQEVKENSLASLSNIRVGDILLEINDVEVNSQNDLFRLSFNDSDNYELTILREGEEIKIPIVLNSEESSENND